MKRTCSVMKGINTLFGKHHIGNVFVGISSASCFGYGFFLCAMLNIAHPTEMKADGIANVNLPSIEVVSDSGIIANIERRTGTKLPDLYNKKLKTFTTTNRIMKDEGSAKFTEDFIVKQMQRDRGISKQSQLLFIWTHVHYEITNTYLYDGSDGDENRLDEYGNVMERAEKCGKDFRSSYIAYTKQRSAEGKLESFTKSINEYNDFINKHKNFIDKNAVEDAYIIISTYKGKIGELQKRLENLRVVSQNIQNLSASEIESMNDMGKQLLSDIDGQRAAMFKQRIVVAEKNYAATEKKIAETQQKIASAETINDGILQKINEAMAEIVEAKQNIDKAKTNSSENSLKSAEYDLLSAEAKHQSAEARQQSAEARQQSIEATNTGLKQIVDYYYLCKKHPSTVNEKELEETKEYAKHVIQNCKKYNIDYKAKLSKDVLEFYGIE